MNWTLDNSLGTEKIYILPRKEYLYGLRITSYGLLERRATQELDKDRRSGFRILVVSWSKAKRSSSNGSKLSSQVRSLARTRSGSEAPYAGVGGNDYGYEQVRDGSTVPIARSHSEGVSGAPYSSTKRRVVNEEEAPLLGREEEG